MTRYILHAVPLLVLFFALFGFAVEFLDVEPRQGSVIRLALLEQPKVPAAIVFGTWLMEAAGLVALYLLARGRCGTWWLDGLVAGWTAWIFRGPLLVITIVVAARQPQDAWWSLAFGWWVLYSICGLSLAILDRRQEASDESDDEGSEEILGAGGTTVIETKSEAAVDETTSDEEGAGESEAGEEAPRDEESELYLAAAESPPPPPTDVVAQADEDEHPVEEEVEAAEAESVEEEAAAPVESEEPSGDAEDDPPRSVDGEPRGER